MKIGIIGYGNIGSLIANNILKLNLLLENEELIISNRHIEKINQLKEEYKEQYLSKLELTDDNTKIAKECEKIIISVETPQFKGIIEEIIPHIKPNTHIIYTCAGLDFRHIETFYKGKLTLIIPTIASTTTDYHSIKSLQRRKGISLIQHNNQVNEDEKSYIEDLFNEFSYVKIVENSYLKNKDKKEDEKNNKKEVKVLKEDTILKTQDNLDNELEIATILTSSGPAFLAIIIKKLAEISSEKSNFSYNECEEMISKTILGTIQLKETKNLTNEEIMNKVATKKGITQEGIDYLDEEFDKIGNNLIRHLLNRYDEVKEDMDKDYLNNNNFKK